MAPQKTVKPRIGRGIRSISDICHGASVYIGMPITDIPDDPQRQPKTVFHKLLPYTTVAMLIAMLYAGWIFYSRHQDSVKNAAGNR